METARTSETSVDIDLRTRYCIPGDFELNLSSSLNVRDRVSHRRKETGSIYRYISDNITTCLIVRDITDSLIS
jgi:hypothetical protein